MAANGKVFVSVVPQDRERCAPLIKALDGWKVPYLLDSKSTEATLTAPAQQALNMCSVLLRVCTPAAQRSPRWQAKAQAFHAAQMRADDGKSGPRKIINLVYDPDFTPDPADPPAIQIKANALMGAPWVVALRRELRELKGSWEPSHRMLITGIAIVLFILSAWFVLTFYQLSQGRNLWGQPIYCGSPGVVFPLCTPK